MEKTTLQVNSIQDLAKVVYQFNKVQPKNRISYITLPYEDVKKVMLAEPLERELQELYGDRLDVYVDIMTPIPTILTYRILVQCKNNNKIEKDFLILNLKARTCRLFKDVDRILETSLLGLSKDLGYVIAGHYGLLPKFDLEFDVDNNLIIAYPAIEVIDVLEKLGVEWENKSFTVDFVDKKVEIEYQEQGYKRVKIVKVPIEVVSQYVDAELTFFAEEKKFIY